MDDVAVRPRYPRSKLQNKRERKIQRDTGSIGEKIMRQAVLAVILLVIVGIIKSVNTPVTNFLSEKIKIVLSQNIEAKSIFENLGQLVSKFTDSKKSNNLEYEGNIEVNNDDAEQFEEPSVTASAASYESEYESEDVEELQDIENSEEMPLEEEVVVQENTTKEAEQKTSKPVQTDKNTLKPQQTEKSTNPVNNKYSLITPVAGTLESEFGERIHPISKKLIFHKGVDIAANSGTPIKSAIDGEVIIAGYDATYGNYVKIKHADGITTIYAHCSKLVAKKGQKVKKGGLIAYVGSTGDSIGPHLHFEIAKDGKVLNPLNLIKVPLKK